MVKQLFTNDVALDQCKDCRAPDPASAKVSNLTSNPKINMKYDDAWFLQQNPQSWNNIRTMGLMKDLTKKEDDPIMRLNPTLYKVVENKQDPNNFTDPFQKIMQQ